MSEPLNLKKSFELYEKARRLIPGASQTNSKRATAFAFGAYPMFLERGRGSHVWDVDGNEYIDYVAAMGPITLGYCYPAVDEAIRKQLARGIVFSLPSPLEVEAAEAVTGAVPGAEKVRFFKGGGEATAVAARIARAFTGREKIASSGYHGWADVWTAMRNDGGVPKALEAVVRNFAFNDIPALEALLAEWEGEVAAVILNPAEREEPKPGYLARVKELAHNAGALLIFDEVITGFRVALGGAAEAYGVIPDMSCFAKGIANGMPVSAVAGRADVMDRAEKLVVTVTYGGEALSLAAVVASIREYRERDVFSHMRRIGERLKRELNAAAAEVGSSFHVSGSASLPMYEMSGDDEEETKLMWDVFLQEVARGGVLCRRAGINFTTFSHSDEDVERTAEVCGEALATVEDRRRDGTLKQYSTVGEYAPAFRTF